MSQPPVWPPHFFDLTDPDGPGLDTAVELPLLIDWLVHEARRTPDWRVDERDRPMLRLSVVAQEERSARIAFVSGHIAGELALSCDPSGWLRVEASVAGRHVFRAFLDRPYEEYELWPDGAREQSIDPPGRMGKKRNWLSLRADAWPALRPLANDNGWVNLHALDFTTIYVRLLGGAEMWRATRGVPAELGFELFPTDGYDPTLETWEFPPGSVVRCEMRKLGESDAVVAVALAPRLMP